MHLGCFHEKVASLPMQNTLGQKQFRRKKLMNLFISLYNNCGKSNFMYLLL